MLILSEHNGLLTTLAAVMALQAFRNLIPRGELVGVGALVVNGLALIVLAPAKRPAERVSAAVV